jgi:RNA recognition motif-containing protein
MNIYVSNLSSLVGNDELKQIFSVFGDVKSAEISNDLFTGESRGFGYVEMDNEDAAQKAIDGLNKSTLHELTISVEPAKPKQVHLGSYKVGNGRVDAYRFKKN